MILIQSVCLDRTRELVLQARIGDHGKELINLARTKLAAKGITVQTRNVGMSSPHACESTKADVICISGTNPFPRPPPDDNNWDTVDWKETIRVAENAGVANAKAEVQAVAKDIYEKKAGRNVAREHKQVIDSYRRAEDAKLGCGRS